jgi:hypothetical protein
MDDDETIDGTIGANVIVQKNGRRQYNRVTRWQKALRQYWRSTVFCYWHFDMALSGGTLTEDMMYVPENDKNHETGLC